MNHRPEKTNVARPTITTSSGKEEKRRYNPASPIRLPVR